MYKMDVMVPTPGVHGGQELFDSHVERTFCQSTWRELFVRYRYVARTFWSVSWGELNVSHVAVLFVNHVAGTLCQSRGGNLWSITWREIFVSHVVGAFCQSREGNFLSVT